MAKSLLGSTGLATDGSPAERKETVKPSVALSTQGKGTNMGKKREFKPTMEWPDVVRFIAQAAVNIAEEMTSDNSRNKGCFIENGSPIHKAMIGFCDHLSAPEGLRIVADFMSQRNG